MNNTNGFLGLVGALPPLFLDEDPLELPCVDLPYDDLPEDLPCPDDD